jgi:2-keto-4-pentenoate hydratase/2-oxohepta-3-ene-1,7-dioic acid hydratase in catechol pathway
MPRYVSTTEGVGLLDDGHVQLLDSEYRDLGEALTDGVTLAELGDAPRRANVSVDSAQLLPPVAKPSKIWAVAWAYMKHREEVGHASDHDDPFIFFKAPSSVIATKQPIKIPKMAPSKVDYEGELAVVIGRRASAVDAGDALSYVAGFTIANDVSARDVQKGEAPGRMANISLSKSFDTFTPLGPCISTLEEFQDPNNIRLRTFVDGELRQDAFTADLMCPVADLVAYISQYTTLEPGDVILTGTPAGVGHPEGRFLKAGSTIRIEIESIGTLENHVE